MINTKQHGHDYNTYTHCHTHTYTHTYIILLQLNSFILAATSLIELFAKSTLNGMTSFSVMTTLSKRQRQSHVPCVSRPNFKDVSKLEEDHVALKKIKSFPGKEGVALALPWSSIMYGDKITCRHLD